MLFLIPSLTTPCQTDAFGAPSPPEELIKLFWELEGLNPLHSQKGGYATKGAINKTWLEDTFARVGQVVAESVKAGAECGSFGLQFMPNAFEVSDSSLHPPEWCRVMWEGWIVLKLFVDIRS